MVGSCGKKWWMTYYPGKHTFISQKWNDFLEDRGKVAWPCWLEQSYLLNLKGRRRRRKRISIHLISAVSYNATVQMLKSFFLSILPSIYSHIVFCTPQAHLPFNSLFNLCVLHSSLIVCMVTNTGGCKIPPLILWWSP